MSSARAVTVADGIQTAEIAAPYVIPIVYVLPLYQSSGLQKQLEALTKHNLLYGMAFCYYQCDVGSQTIVIQGFDIFLNAIIMRRPEVRVVNVLYLGNSLRILDAVLEGYRSMMNCVGIRLEVKGFSDEGKLYAFVSSTRVLPEQARVDDTEKH